MTNKKERSFLTVALMILAMLLSKLLGMLRGVLLASLYGISEEATAFSAASRIPLSFFDIVFASAILGCFIPVYNSFSKEDSKGRNRFASIYLNFMLLLTGVLALLGIVFAPELLALIAPDMLPETASLACELLRIMFPLIAFASASYTLVGVLQSNGRFIAPALISAVSNVLVIVYFIFFNDSFGIHGLAFSYTLGWIAQLLTLVFSLPGTGFSHKLILDFKNEGFIKAMKLTPPIIMGSWLAPVALLVGMSAALTTGIAGAVPSFEYAINLFTVITGITTYGICNYIFPKLSRLSASGDDGSFSVVTRSGLSTALVMTTLICAWVFALAPQGVCVVYMRGSFDTVAARQVTLILRALVPGMIGFTLSEVISRVFYAVKRPRYPVISVLFGIATAVVFVTVLVRAMSLGLGALGISYSAAMLSAGGLMLVFASVKLKGSFDRHFFLNCGKILLSGALSAALMYLASEKLLPDPYSSGFVTTVFSAAAAALVGMVLYFAFLALLHEENAHALVKKLLKKR